MKKLLKKTAGGLEVFICADTLLHMKAHPDVRLDDVKEAIAKCDYQPPFAMIAVDLGRVVGKDNCVEVTPDDDVRQLRRKGRSGVTPIVFGREAEDTTLLTLGICQDREDGRNTLFTAFCGKLAPKEPWDPAFQLHPDEAGYQESIDFWNSHAIVWQEGIIAED